MVVSIDRRKVGYIVLSHQNPRQILRLIDRLLRSDPTGHVIVEHDPAHGALELEDYSAHPRVQLITSSSVRRWGNFALVSDLLQAMRWTVTHLDVGWIVVMSGQDYPLRSLTSFGEECAESGFDAFVSGRRIPLRRPPPADTAALYAHARHYYRWYQLPKWLLGWAANRPVQRLVLGAQRRLSSWQPLIFLWSLPRDGGDMIGFRRRSLPFSSDFECYMGSQWMTISRAAAVERHAGW